MGHVMVRVVDHVINTSCVSAAMSERALLLPGREQPVQSERHALSDHLLHGTGTSADGGPG